MRGSFFASPVDISRGYLGTSLPSPGAIIMGTLRSAFSCGEPDPQISRPSLHPTSAERRLTVRPSPVSAKYAPSMKSQVLEILTQICSTPRCRPIAGLLGILVGQARNVCFCNGPKSAICHPRRAAAHWKRKLAFCSNGGKFVQPVKLAEAQVLA
jgi:hypothetical protein